MIDDITYQVVEDDLLDNSVDPLKIRKPQDTGANHVLVYNRITQDRLWVILDDNYISSL